MSGRKEDRERVREGEIRDRGREGDKEIRR